jgi:signal transduction histidine kinase
VSLTSEKALEILSRFSRLVSATAAPDNEMLPLLANAAVDLLDAGGAAVIEVQESGAARIVAVREVPEEMVGMAVELDTIGPELGERLLNVAGGRFVPGDTLPLTVPLVSGGDLFGALVMFFEHATTLDSDQLRLAQGLVDLAATGIGQAVRNARLQRTLSELSASREVLARTEKLRALGQMAAGVSHDLKNVLSPLFLLVQLLKRKPKDPAIIETAALQIEQVVRRGVETVERLRAFSRQTPEETKPAELNRLVKEAIDLSKPRLLRIGSPIDLRVELGDPPVVALQPSELVTSVLNLIVNAVDAMPDGGRITVRTGLGERVPTDGDPGDDDPPPTGWVAVEDDGPGIPPELERRIFEPFFTTKGEEGTGLGLALVYAFVRRHGGAIQVDTQLGRGTRFTLSFPAVRQGTSSVRPLGLQEWTSGRGKL